MASQWKPIKDAPKETWVIIRGGGPDYCWDGDENDTPPMVVAKLRKGHYGDWWQFAYYDSGWLGKWAKPTEWMELPD